jgi:hypothetical protein
MRPLVSVDPPNALDPISAGADVIRGIGDEPVAKPTGNAGAGDIGVVVVDLGVSDPVDRKRGIGQELRGSRGETSVKEGWIQYPISRPARSRRWKATAADRPMVETDA